MYKCMYLIHKELNFIMKEHSSPFERKNNDIGSSSLQAKMKAAKISNLSCDFSSFFREFNENLAKIDQFQMHKGIKVFLPHVPNKILYISSHFVLVKNKVTLLGVLEARNIVVSERRALLH